MPVMEISIVPLGTQTASVSAYVAKAVEVLKKQKGIKYQLTAMGTIVEADSVTQLLTIAGRMHAVVLSKKIKRVVTTLTIDERRDKALTIEGKLSSVKQKM